MPNPVIFVPYSKDGKNFSLYTMICKDDSISKYWNVHEDDSPKDNDVLHGDIDKKLADLQDYFKDEAGRKFELALVQDKKSLARLTDSTPSVFLGLFICALLELESEKHRYWDTWESVTFTGDVEIKNGAVRLKSVGNIEEKYRGFSQEIQAYRENHPGKHLFLYVGETPSSTLEPCGGVEVRGFTKEDSWKKVSAFLFSDAEQDRLLKYISTSLQTWEYVSTPAFNKLKEEALSKDWKGFFIHGEGERGKSAFALALAKELMKDGCIYAPIWISIDDYFKNIDFASTDIDDNYDLLTLKKKNPLIKDSITYYIASRIGELLQLGEWTPKHGSEPLRKAMQAYRYLLVIDNLESDKVDQVLNAVDTIISDWDSKPPVILTSSYSWKYAEYYQQLGLKSIEPPMLEREEVAALVQNIAKREQYEQKVTAAAETQEYEKFIEELYAHFKSSPGFIAVIVPLLERKTMPELLPNLLSIGQKPFTEKAEALCKMIFDELDVFSQGVLFAFIGSTRYQHKEMVSDKQSIMHRLETSGWTLNGAVPKKWELEEKIPQALDNLVHAHILYRTGEQGDCYAIKSVPLVTFMFSDKFSGETLSVTGKTWQETLIGIKRMIFAGLFYNQKLELLNSLFKKLEAEKKSIASLYILHHAVVWSNISEPIIAFLIDNCGINAKGAYGLTPLHCAAKFNTNPKVIEYLLANGADVHAKDKNGLTPLHYAAWYNANPKVIEYLLDKGADINAKAFQKIDLFNSLYGLTPLHCAVAYNTLEVIKNLLAKGADINATMKIQDTYPLHYEFELHYEFDGATPLHYAVAYNTKLEVIKYLLEYLLKNHVDIHAKDKNGLTPLHYAAKFNTKLEVIKYLLANGANIHAKDNDEKTPIYYAEAFNTNPEICEYLLKNGAKIHPDAKQRLANRNKLDMPPAVYEQQNEVENSAEGLIDSGNSFMSEDNFDYEEAISVYTKAIHSYPTKNAEAYYRRGYAFYKMGYYDRAIVDFTKSIEIEPKGINAYQWRSHLYTKKEQKDLAKADLEQFLQLQGDTEAIHWEDIIVNPFTKYM